VTAVIAQHDISVHSVMVFTTRHIISLTVNYIMCITLHMYITSHQLDQFDRLRCQPCYETVTLAQVNSVSPGARHLCSNIAFVQSRNIIWTRHVDDRSDV